MATLTAKMWVKDYTSMRRPNESLICYRLTTASQIIITITPTSRAMEAPTEEVNFWIWIPLPNKVCHIRRRLSTNAITTRVWIHLHPSKTYIKSRCSTRLCQCLISSHRDPHRDLNLRIAIYWSTVPFNPEQVALDLTIILKKEALHKRWMKWQLRQFKTLISRSNLDFRSRMLRAWCPFRWLRLDSPKTKIAFLQLIKCRSSIQTTLI